MRRAQPLLGTFFEISLESADKDGAIKAIDAGFREAKRLERMLNFYDPESEISRLNSFPESPRLVSPEVLELLSFCCELSEESDGLFDISTPESIRSEEPTMLFEKEGVTFRRGLKVNLGGVAKGYVVDKVTERLLDYPVTEIVVNAGGDLRVARTSGVPVAIRDPREPENFAAMINLASGAIATSSGYFALSTLFDPSSNSLVNHRDSVSVVADSCMVADALTKIVSLKSPIADLILSSYDAQALVLGAGQAGELTRESLP